MPLPRTTTADFTRHLEALGMGVGDRVLLHSRLLAFGDLEGGVAHAAEALLDQVGEGGTLVVPTYTFDISPYDRRAKPGEACGALSESLRKLPQARRSGCPIHNHAGLGPAASLLERSDPGQSLGPRSDFDLMRDEGFTQVLLGCNFTEACTFLHHMEAVAEVPYRHWIGLERQVVDEDGTIRTIPVRYFARSRSDLVTDFEPVCQRMEALGLLVSAPCVFGRSYVCSLADLHRVAAEMLAENPMALVRCA